MNKAEQKEFERLKTMLALKYWPEVLPDVAPPTTDISSLNKLTTGYVFNAYSKTVSVACSSSVSHAIGRTDKTTSQKPISMYSTKKMAYQAMLHEMSERFAYEMRRVEINMENECK
jgi:hypothetical protein